MRIDPHQPLAIENVYPGGIWSGAKLMAAAGAELIRGPYAPEAVSTTGRKLAIALWAKMEIALHVRSASRAMRHLGLAQQEVQHRADTARHGQADHDPEARVH